MQIAQWIIFNTVITHYCQILIDNQIEFLHLNVNNLIDIEKFYLINCITDYLAKITFNSERLILFVCVIFIDVIIFNIKNRILHNLLKFFICEKNIDLFNQIIVFMQKSLQHVQYIIIDEKFMIELQVLNKISSWLCQIFTKLKKIFDDYNVIIFNDFYQLFSIINKSLYHVLISTRNLDISIQNEFNIYWMIDYFVILNQIMQ